MAQKSKKGFSRFLDFIGLEVSDDEEEMMEEEETPRSRSRSTRSDRSRADSDRTARNDRNDRSERMDRSERYERSGSSARTRDRDAEFDRYSSLRSSRTGSAGRSERTAAREEDEYWQGSWSTRSEKDNHRESSREPVREREPAREPVREPVRESDSSSRHQTVIFHLRRFEDSRDVILALLERKSVLLNLDPLDDNTAQRVIDTMGGAAFALGAMISKASDKNYLITPNNVVVANANVEPRQKSSRYM